MRLRGGKRVAGGVAEGGDLELHRLHVLAGTDRVLNRPARAVSIVRGTVAGTVDHHLNVLNAPIGRQGKRHYVTLHRQIARGMVRIARGVVRGERYPRYLRGRCINPDFFLRSCRFRKFCDGVVGPGVAHRVGNNNSEVQVGLNSVIVVAQRDRVSVVMPQTRRRAVS